MLLIGRPRYPVRAATTHQVMDNFRTETFHAILQGGQPSASACLTLGELMLQSHSSYSRVGLGSRGTDLIVGLVRRHIEEAKRRKSQPALYGARITGGGSGGTVCILGAASEEAEQAVAQIAASYRDATKHSPIVFSGSSSGSELFGALTLQRHAASP